jgi:AraC family transcriptional regulator of adaptative response/methylated-DNA-[protein]-cysteine methyltransferase
VSSKTDILEELRNLEEERWQAVLSRDSRLDNEFVFAVRSTGVYCRPSCPARRPLRENVQFFTFPEDAEEAGYRPCLRCHPRGTSVPGHQSDLVRDACQAIDESSEPVRLADLGAQLGVSPAHLQRTFKRVMGVTPRQYAESVRASRFKQQVRDGDSVTGAMYVAGYGSSSRLYESASHTFGMTPASYRRGGEGATIAYTILDCPLGRLLVAATDRGICAVSLGDSDEALYAELAGEYPAAGLHRDDAGLGEWAGAIVRYMDGAQAYLDLPLDIAATAFQLRVWEELRAIPYGATRSYSEIARRLGEPGAARAVAQACAHNRVALLIPCHRVVREGGDPGGYRWGTWRKERLLNAERAAHTAEEA